MSKISRTSHQSCSFDNWSISTVRSFRDGKIDDRDEVEVVEGNAFGGKIIGREAVPCSPCSPFIFG
jgi:hypothetical protein